MTAPSMCTWCHTTRKTVITDAAQQRQRGVQGFPGATRWKGSWVSALWRGRRTSGSVRGIPATDDAQTLPTSQPTALLHSRHARPSCHPSTHLHHLTFITSAGARGQERILQEPTYFCGSQGGSPWCARSSVSAALNSETVMAR
jgi:hypothetical protein